MKYLDMDTLTTATQAATWTVPCQHPTPTVLVRFMFSQAQNDQSCSICLLRLISPFAAQGKTWILVLPQDTQIVPSCIFFTNTNYSITSITITNTVTTLSESSLYLLCNNGHGFFSQILHSDSQSLPSVGRWMQENKNSSPLSSTWGEFQDQTRTHKTLSQK